ncbi:MAG TPA: glycosyltransferase [Puia sp.]|nr:glycosyltransferase [Puia sp.]
MIEVSVCVFAYNFGKYIEHCLQSILQQKTNFGYEIIVGDDLSTDDTRTICLDYARKYPDIIRLSFNERNEGLIKNWNRTFNQAKGKYIAIIDGDDYFCSNEKLQKQFDAMEADAGAVLCFHNVKEIHKDASLDTETKFENRIYTCKDFMKGWFVRTSSIFFRNNILPDPMPDWVFDFPNRLDSIMPVMLNEKGHTIFINETLSVWRKHNAGTSNLFKIDVLGNLQTILALYSQLNIYTQKKYNGEVQQHISTLYTGIMLELIKDKKVLANFSLFLKSILMSDKIDLIKKVFNQLGK